jgi:hypothetical protein
MVVLLLSVGTTSAQEKHIGGALKFFMGESNNPFSGPRRMTSVDEFWMHEYEFSLKDLVKCLNKLEELNPTNLLTVTGNDVKLNDNTSDYHERLLYVK